LALIVGHIEDEASLAKVHGFGVLYGQGALFGGPRAVAVEGTAAPRTAAA
jgi:cyclic-di-GMP phosphodiesterase TipF (flagellum assembly factor)